MKTTVAFVNCLAKGDLLAGKSPVVGYPVGDFLVVFPHFADDSYLVSGWEVLYWPSCKVVGARVFESREGAIAFAVDADKLLGTEPEASFFSAVVGGEELAHALLAKYGASNVK